LLTAEAAVRRVLQRWHRKFETLNNQTLRQRADDVLDLGRNVIRRLRGQQDAALTAIPEQSVLVVERLLPSDVVVLPKSHVAAVVVESLGQGSHAALLSREKGIPTIAELPGILSQVETGTELLVDGFSGSLVIAPTLTTRTDFEERMGKWPATLVRCKAACRDPARTPAAALAIASLVKHVDFFCVGTNDLAQYTLAAARDDASVSEYYLDAHESIMRLLGIIVAEAADRPVTLCGELAGREAYVPRLLQMGFRALSVVPTVIPTTKSLIRTLDLGDSASGD
jgi:phosphoenolpyruvate-protein kinase (PTS system EI component)